MNKTIADAMSVLLNSLSNTQAYVQEPTDTGLPYGVYALYHPGDVRYRLKDELWSVEGLRRFLDTRRGYEILQASAMQTDNRRREAE